MAEPATAASVVAAGAGALLLTTLGIEPGPLFWALVGGCIGMSFAGPASRTRAALVFVCVVLACSLFGAALATYAFKGEPLWRNVFSCLLAICFHPALNAIIRTLPDLVAKVPEAVDGLLRRWGLKQ